MAKTIVGLFDDPTEARAAAQELIHAGVRREDISLMTRHGAQPVHVGPTNAGNDASMIADPTDDVGTGVLAGVSVGAVLGGIGGLLVGLAVLPLPGIGPIVAAGPIVSALAGLGLGAATGGLVGALTNIGVPAEHAPRYAEALRRGGTVVTVSVDDALAPRVWGVMTNHNAVDVNQRAAAWRGDGWDGDHPAAPAYAPGEIAPAVDDDDIARDAATPSRVDDAPPAALPVTEARPGVSTATQIDPLRTR